MAEDKTSMSSSLKKADAEAIRTAVTDFASSQLFQRTFDDGMALVEETAAYLDGKGREDSKSLPRRGALAYAGESMRVTTRLMQVASWLLVQRAVREDEMTPDEASDEKYRLSAQEVCRARPLDGADLVPARLKELLEQSCALYDRVERLDHKLYREGRREDSASAIQAQHSLIAAAFAKPE